MKGKRNDEEKTRRMAVLPKAFGTHCLQQKMPALQTQMQAELPCGYRPL